MNKRLGVEVTFADLAQCGIHRRHHRRNDDAVDALDFNLIHGEQVAEEHTVFVHRLSCDGGDTPVGHQQTVGPAQSTGIQPGVVRRDPLAKTPSTVLVLPTSRTRSIVNVEPRRIRDPSLQENFTPRSNLLQPHRSAQHRPQTLCGSYQQKSARIESLGHAFKAAIFFDPHLPSAHRR